MPTVGSVLTLRVGAQPTMIDLDTLLRPCPVPNCNPFSIGLGINNRSEVVGVSTLASGAFRAFLSTSREGMVNLGTLGR